MRTEFIDPLVTKRALKRLGVFWIYRHPSPSTKAASNRGRAMGTLAIKLYDITHLFLSLGNKAFNFA